MQDKERSSITDFMKNLTEPMPLDKKVALLIRNNAVKVYTMDRGQGPEPQSDASKAGEKLSIK